MKLGFIGTGTIAEAVIDGVMGSRLDVDAILVSPRSAATAARLAQKYVKVRVGDDNQAVVDASDYVFVCLRSQDAQEALEKLRFRNTQTLISLIAMATRAEVKDWTKNSAPVFRAIPLPFIAQGLGKTPIFPSDPLIRTFFDNLGGSIVLDNENDLSAFLVAGSMMGVYFRFINTCSQWLESKGIDHRQAASFLAAMFGNLSDSMRKADCPDFALLEEAYSTRGGTNELLSNIFQKLGGADALKTAGDQVYTALAK